VAINLLLDLEKEVNAYASSNGLSLLPHVRPTQLAGIEINPYAQQLAQVVIWIGYLQWMHHNGYAPPRNPVLEPIESIHLMDAIMDLSVPEHPLEPQWPSAEFIVGNPPFLGSKLHRGNLGEEYMDFVQRLWDGRVLAESDLCCYWFEKARKQIEQKNCRRAGLLATQGIRGGSNRETLKRIKNTGDIFFAESDRDWILDGANVHVSMVGFDNGSERQRTLDRQAVSEIHSNLSATSDITQARELLENKDLFLRPPEKGAKFDVTDAETQPWLCAPNPNGRPNSDVLRPWTNAELLVSRRDAMWIVDFNTQATEAEAAQFESPFEYIRLKVKDFRSNNRDERMRRLWWQYRRPGVRVRDAQQDLSRILCTPMVSKYRLFTWLPPIIQPDKTIYCFAFENDYFFGVLHSRLHEVWARAQGTQVRERESGFRYTPTTCFETFPFPKPTKQHEEAIAAAAKELDRLRNNWLNPPEWTREEILEFPGSVDGPWKRYVVADDGATGRGSVPVSPKPETGTDPGGIGTVRYPRTVPKDEECAKALKKRTLTSLYNERPTWLDLAHKNLDEAVFAAYGWDAAMSDEEVLAALLKLNLERAR
ncbi:MAG: DNA methyltransferase, partial [Planctomycetaceae bacterium]